MIMLRIIHLKSLGRCEYPSASEVTSTYVSYGGVFRRQPGNGWGTMGSVTQISSDDDRPIVDYTTRCVGDRPETDQHCTNKLTYESCVNHTVGPASIKYCVWQG